VRQSAQQRREYLSSSYPHCALLERVRPDYGNRRSHSGRGTNVKWFTPSRNYSPSDVGPLNVYRSSDTACAVFRLPLQCRHAGQGDNLSFGADGIWGLFGRPSERAREQCAGPGHQVSVRVGAASGLYRPVSAGTRASPQPDRSQGRDGADRRRHRGDHSPSEPRSVSRHGQAVRLPGRHRAEWQRVRRAQCVFATGRCVTALLSE